MAERVTLWRWKSLTPADGDGWKSIAYYAEPLYGDDGYGHDPDDDPRIEIRDFISSTDHESELRGLAEELDARATKAFELVRKGLREADGG